jgi:hypothetical protein
MGHALAAADALAPSVPDREAVARAIRDETCCGYGLEGAAVFCDDERLDEENRSETCYCRAAADAVLALLPAAPPPVSLDREAVARTARDAAVWSHAQTDWLAVADAVLALLPATRSEATAAAEQRIADLTRERDRARVMASDVAEANTLLKDRAEAAEKERDEARAMMARLEHLATDHYYALQAAEVRLARAREALQFYARGDWSDLTIQFHQQRAQAAEARLARAREALERADRQFCHATPDMREVAGSIHEAIRAITDSEPAGRDQEAQR